jgi:hypothetical protein
MALCMKASPILADPGEAARHSRLQVGLRMHRHTECFCYQVTLQVRIHQATQLVQIPHIRSGLVKPM